MNKLTEEKAKNVAGREKIDISQKERVCVDKSWAKAKENIRDRKIIIKAEDRLFREGPFKMFALLFFFQR